MKAICSFLVVLCAAVFATACGGYGKSLSRVQADKFAAKLWQEKLSQTEAELGAMWDAQLFELRGLKMPVYAAIFGEKPADGRSLYISMHGGGRVSAKFNDQQWSNQKTLYDLSEGVYIVPRAAVDDYDMWSRPFLDTLFPMIIRAAVVRADVNPNKVYIMGYSAGGDGVYRMAPRLADKWAAAAMMAGTWDKRVSSPLNLRNIGFTIWMGALDSAFNRNARAVKFSGLLDSLRAADPDGYVHSLNVVPGKGHWMNNADTLAVEWLSHFRRNPLPDRVVWRQEERRGERNAIRQNFYWLSIPAGEARAGREVQVARNGNTLTILRNDYKTLHINLNDSMMNLDKPVVIMHGGKEIFAGHVPRRELHIRTSIDERADPDYIFSASIEVTPEGVRVL